jgi:hypothetical protein
MAPVGSGAVGDSEVGLSGGEIGTDCALATAKEPRADDALFCGGFSFMALGAIPSFTGCNTGTSSFRPKSNDVNVGEDNSPGVIFPQSNESGRGVHADF